MSSRKELHTVFVVGAGFSAGLDYPLTSQLLPRLLTRLDSRFKNRFGKVIRFHHPEWDGRAATLPEIEHFLTELAANEDLLPTIRTGGPFDLDELQEIRDELLNQLALWFHEIHEDHKQRRHAILDRFVERLSSVDNPVIISFNWDYELDRALFSDETKYPSVSSTTYGLDDGIISFPFVLKPHGSLNWYTHETGKHIREDLRVLLWGPPHNEDSMYCFIRWRQPQSTKGRQYVPWIVPPTNWKKFDHPMMQRIWKRCVDCLSTASHVYFLGYSLPLADWHSRYIFRCGFHNQVEGRPLEDGTREDPSGVAKVTIVNPENSAFRRIETVAGVRCKWVPTTILEWLSQSE